MDFLYRFAVKVMDVNETLDLQQKVARLQALLEVSRRIHATIQLDEVLRVALEIVVLELEMEGAYFTSFPFSEGRIQPHSLLNPNGSELGGGSFRFALRDKAGELLTELVVIPREGMPLTLEESDFLEQLTLQIAIAIENARNHERIIHLQRVEQDLASARAIQRSLLPSSVQALAGYKTAFRSISSYEVGGDYLDLLRAPSGEQIMIVADVAGKGLTSAMIASSFRAAFRAMIMAGVPLVEVAQQLNALCYAEGPEARNRYVTAVFFRLDPEANLLEVLNAGHNPALLWTTSAHGPALLGASGTPIGVQPSTQYASEKYELEEGARLLAYTDGLTEVFRGDEEFGLDRLIDTFRAGPLDAEAALDHIWTTLEAFTTEPEQRDDMTALVLLRNG
jgi:serine phosphatase RsbU (regulator of sigma subunit)